MVKEKQMTKKSARKWDTMHSNTETAKCCFCPKPDVNHLQKHDSS